MSDDPFALVEQPTGPIKDDEADLDYGPPGDPEPIVRKPEHETPKTHDHPSPCNYPGCAGPVSPSVPAVPSPVSETEVAKVSKWSGRVALGGLALAGAAAGIYYSSKPPRKRKKKTEGERVGIIGMGVGAAAAVLAGAAYATSKMIAQRIKPKSKHPWRR